jgi:hypothetical protein
MQIMIAVIRYHNLLIFTYIKIEHSSQLLCILIASYGLTTASPSYSRPSGGDYHSLRVGGKARVNYGDVIRYCRLKQESAAKAGRGNCAPLPTVRTSRCSLRSLDEDLGRNESSLGWLN